MMPCTSSPKRSRSPAPTTRKSCATPCTRVKYEGIVANYNPAFEKTVERHDAILPSQYKLLAYHKGVFDAG